MNIVIDAKETVVGRVASYAAKQVLLGRKVDIVNCKYAVISGSPKHTCARYLQRRQRGTHAKGPFHSRQPDRFVRRIVRGMLPFDKPRGKDAFTRVMCYNDIPEQYKQTTPVVLKEAHMSKLPTLKYVTVQEICTYLGGKVQ